MVMFFPEVSELTLQKKKTTSAPPKKTNKHVLVLLFIKEHKILHCYRIPEWLRLKGTPGGHLVQVPSSGRVTQSQLCRTVFRCVLKISNEGDSTTAVGNQCSSTLTAKKCFLFRWTVHWAPYFHPLCTFLSGIYTHQ